MLQQFQSKQGKPYKVLFVCLGNICRSPTADGVFQEKLLQADLADALECDSAGTSAWHIGEPPDARSTEHAARRGFKLDHLRARQVEVDDFYEFDLILAMDQQNLEDLETLQAEAKRQAVSRSREAKAQLALFLDHPHANELGRSVPDPYHGGARGFDEVLDLVEEACEGWLAAVKEA